MPRPTRGSATQIRPLPGAVELLAWLTEAGIPWAIATSGRMETAAVNLAALGVDPAVTPVVTRDQVRYAKPDPDLFVAAAERLGVPIETAVVVGDAIWDMLAAVRCRALGVGLLSGGYGAEELRQGGAIRVFETPPTSRAHRRGGRPAVAGAVNGVLVTAGPRPACGGDALGRSMQALRFRRPAC